MEDQPTGAVVNSSGQSLGMDTSSPRISTKAPRPASMSDAVAGVLRQLEKTNELANILNKLPTLEELKPCKSGNNSLSLTTELSPTPLHTSSSPAFHVVNIPGKGKGVVALRDLQEGSLLLLEKPMVVLDWSKEDLTEGDLFMTLNKELDKLSEEDQKAFHQLHVATPVEFLPRSNAIFRSNAIGFEPGQNVGGVFKLASRLNHSCRPSIVWGWNGIEGLLHVKVVRDVKKGEELTASYTDPLFQSKERQMILKSRYGFDCACEVCSSSSKLIKSDKRRQEIQQILVDVSKPPKPESLPLGHQSLCLRGLKLFEKEKIRSSSEGDLAYVALMMSVIYGYRETADLWIAQILKLSRRTAPSEPGPLDTDFSSS